MTTMAASRLSGYALVCYFVLSRLAALEDPMLRHELRRQIHATGISALPVLVVLAALAGATAVTQVSSLVGHDSDLSQRLLFYGLFFELAPLMTAVVIVARSSAAIASELAVMQVHDEYTALRRMGVPAAEYVLLPRVAALAVSIPVASMIAQGVAVTSGWIAVALLQDVPLLAAAGRFFDLATPGIAALGLAKSLAMGLAVGVIAAYHGCSGDRSTRSISTAAMLAVGSGLVAVFVVDIAFAALAYFLR